MKNRLRFCAQIINENVKGNKINLLDVGGDKQELKNFLSPKIKYQSIDYPEVDLEKDKLPFSSKKFDTVACLEVMEHLKNPLPTLKELKRVMKDSGIAFVSFPNFYFLFNRLKVLFGLSIDKAFQLNFHDKHLHMPSIKEARQFVNKEFRIEKEYYYAQFDNRDLPTQWLGSLYPNLFCWSVVMVCKKR
jgi:SAM-dependent methyltransferase